MKYGCIGAHLGHSFSKEIHGLLGNDAYELCEIPHAALDAFMRARQFCGINVTIPYKEAVIPYLDEMDAAAKEIGAVNTILHVDGKLYGYNTDFFGMHALIERAGISLKNKKVLILGTGGTSKTAYAVAKAMGAAEIFKVSRKKAVGTLTYEDVYEQHQDADILINTTPKGMYPDIWGAPVLLDGFSNLSGVIDVVYNPLKTKLILEAEKRNIPYAQGLYMLTAQAVRAYEIFTGEKIATEKTEAVFQETLHKKQNIVLIGMPAAGKTTIGNRLEKEMGRELLDTDTCIERNAQTTIDAIFKTAGESVFRDMETDIIKELAPLGGKIIATGGGAILRQENIDALKANGILFFLDRPLADLIPTKTRPTASTYEAIRQRYEERYEKYLGAADKHIKVDGDEISVAKTVMEEFLK